MARLPVKARHVLKTLEQVKREAKKSVSVVIVGSKDSGKKTLRALLVSSSAEASEIFSLLDWEGDSETIKASIKGADVVLIMLDAMGDLKKDVFKAKEILRMNESFLIVVNKVDLVPDLELALQSVWFFLDRFASKVVFISALKSVSVEDELVPKILEIVDLKRKGISLASKAPIFRKSAASKIISQTSVQNGLIGAVTILPGSDMPLLTANQLRMVLKIAAIYDEELSLNRLKELITVVGTGLTFRALARQLLDLVPGVGWIVKGAVAFVGTEALGKAAQKYFEKGFSHLKTEDIKEAFSRMQGGKIWRKSEKN